MRKKIITILLLMMLLIQNMAIITYGSENGISENYSKIYVQHDSEKNNKYILNSEGEETTVYQIIDNIIYTPCKQWTRDGLYIDDETGKISATSKENYIPVKESEIYFVKLYGIGGVYKGESGNEFHITAPIVYFDDDDNCIGYALSCEYSASKSGKEIIIPAGATRMYISNYNNQNITIQKKLTLNKEEFNKIKETQNLILNSLEENYEKEKEDPMLYDELDKCYITFVQDDSRSDVDEFADLFINKGTPLCFAAIADNLLNTSSNLSETRLDVAKRVQKVGGEILAHSGPVVTENTIEDENFMYNYFVIQKQLLTNMGFDVNGIILAGGTGQIVGDKRTAKWVNTLYKYSDLLGERYNKFGKYESTYNHYRTGLLNYRNNIDKIKEDIDKAIANKEWKVFYFHDKGEITPEILEEVIDYINSKGKENVEVVTYKSIYNKFAKRESTIKNDLKTYYVSSDGTSTDGTDEENPINLKTLKTKNIKSGDTILFKRGDIFFEDLNISITKMNDKSVKISNYGKGELPTFCAYKYIQNEWEKYAENIYRIDIKDIKNFTGYIGETENAYNVGFLEDDKENKYYNKKISLENLSDKYDFYSDGKQYLYMYCDKNPYTELGNLKVSVKTNLMTLHSNMEIDGIRFSYCGGHGLVGADENEENIKITNCIIENIGGSYLYKNKETRYGNGIEFYGCNAKEIIVKDNIFRNIYDVGFTIQGNSGSGTNVDVCNNIFANNTQDSEIWENGTATGVVSYTFHDNISINQGRGWGYDARPDKYAAGHILFWGYKLQNTDISFKNNLVYNPRRIYFIEQTNGTNIFFKEKDLIKSNNNTYWLADDSRIFRDSYKVEEKDTFIEEYKKDSNSVFNKIVLDEKIINISSASNDIWEIRKLFGIEEHIVHLGGNATCIKKAVCDVCNAEYGNYAEHNYDEGKITKIATYDEEGEKTYTCTVCKTTKVEVLPKLTKTEQNKPTIDNGAENKTEKPEIEKTETEKPEEKPETEKTEAEKPEEKPEIEKTETEKPEEKPETEKTETEKPEEKPETEKTEVEKPEEKPETEKTETEKPEEKPETENNEIKRQNEDTENSTKNVIYYTSDNTLGTDLSVKAGKEGTFGFVLTLTISIISSVYLCIKCSYL